MLLIDAMRGRTQTVKAAFMQALALLGFVHVFSAWPMGEAASGKIKQATKRAVCALRCCFVMEQVTMIVFDFERRGAAGIDQRLKQGAWLLLYAGRGWGWGRSLGLSLSGNGARLWFKALVLRCIKRWRWAMLGSFMLRAQ